MAQGWLTAGKTAHSQVAELVDAKLTDRMRWRGMARIHTGSNPVLTTIFYHKNKNLYYENRIQTITNMF